MELGRRTGGYVKVKGDRQGNKQRKMLGSEKAQNFTSTTGPPWRKARTNNIRLSRAPSLSVLGCHTSCLPSLRRLHPTLTPALLPLPCHVHCYVALPLNSLDNSLLCILLLSIHSLPWILHLPIHCLSHLSSPRAWKKNCLQIDPYNIYLSRVR